MMMNVVGSLRSVEPNVPILIVDDGSPVGKDVVNIYKDLDARYEGLYFKYNYQNLGYSISINRAIDFAKQYNADWLATVNNDLYFKAGFTHRLYHLSESIPFAGVVGAKLVYPDGTIQHAGVNVEPSGLCVVESSGANDFLDDVGQDAVRFCHAVTGALQFIKCKPANKVAHYSDKYKLAYEDVEYCLRNWQEGRAVVYDGSIWAVHAESATRGKTVTPTEKASFEQFLNDFEKMNYDDITAKVFAANARLKDAYGRQEEAKRSEEDATRVSR